MSQRARVLLPLLVLAGCAGESRAPEAPVAPAPPPVDASQTSFDFDASAIQSPPPPALPAERLTPKAFDASNIVSHLLRTTEAFEKQDEDGPRVRSASHSWSLELDPSQGRVLALRNRPSAAAATVDQAQLQKLSVDRLSDFGIPSAEIERVLQRRVDKQELDGDGSTPAPPEVYRYKTFVMRGLAGVPVMGHRAVVTYAADGDFQRVLVHWPALATKGHRLRTRLTAQDIQSRAAVALAREGESTGHVTLRWMYRPVVQPNGETTLTLVVGAGLGTLTTAGQTEEPRIIDVDVDATE